jgi:hypothetical protein
MSLHDAKTTGSRIFHEITEYAIKCLRQSIKPVDIRLSELVDFLEFQRFNDAKEEFSSTRVPPHINRNVRTDSSVEELYETMKTLEEQRNDLGGVLPIMSDAFFMAKVVLDEIGDEIMGYSTLYWQCIAAREKEQKDESIRVKEAQGVADAWLTSVRLKEVVGSIDHLGAAVPMAEAAEH